MRRRATLLLAAIFAVVALGACSGCRAGARETADAGALPARGDRVVVEQTAASFFEGRVLEVRGGELVVEKGEERDLVTVARADAYAIVAREARAGLAICEVARSRWVGCRIEQTNGRLHATDVELAPLELARTLAPSALTELNLQRAFERATRRAAFRRGLAAAGDPRAPKGYAPSPREHVVARRQGAWHGAVVVELQDGGARLRWETDGRESEVRVENMVPEPRGDSPPRRGAFALARPPAPSGAWSAVRIESVGPADVIVVDENESRRTLTARDLLLLGGEPIE
jgi:hypothetical protein